MRRSVRMYRKQQMHLIIVIVSSLLSSINCAAQEEGAAKRKGVSTSPAALIIGRENTGVDDRYAEEIQRLERFVERLMGEHQVPGVAVAFYRDDFTWSCGFGYANLKTKTPVQGDTIFRLASVTKPLTAVAALNLVEAGRLDLDKEVQEYVPYFPKKRWPLTARHLIGHMGGIRDYRESELHLTTHHTTRQAIEIFMESDLIAQPGTAKRYSSYGYDLLGGVIEGAAEMPFDQYLREHVWNPLGMNDTMMGIASRVAANQAQGYVLGPGGPKDCESVDLSSRFAAGGVLSTVEDLMRFSRGLDEGKILDPATQMEMATSMKTPEGLPTEYGMGWGVDCLSGFWTILHPGGQQGATTILVRFPGERFAVAVLCNLENASQFTSKCAAAVYQLVLGTIKTRVESDAPEDFRKLHMVWHTGLGYISKFGKPVTLEAAELTRCFAYINDIDSTKPGARRKIIQGLSEEHGSAVYAIGSYMAHRLGERHGVARLDEYRRGGAIPFFADYIAMYKNDRSIPRSCHFSRDLEGRVASWEDSWKRTWTDETRRFALLAPSEFKDAAPRLLELFKGESVFPSFNMPFEMNTLAYDLKSKGDAKSGLELLLVATELFPSEANLFDSVGEFYLKMGQKAKATEYYSTALKKDPNLRTARIALKRLGQ